MVCATYVRGKDGHFDQVSVEFSWSCLRQQQVDLSSLPRDQSSRQSSQSSNPVLSSKSQQEAALTTATDDDWGVGDNSDWDAADNTTVAAPSNEQSSDDNDTLEQLLALHERKGQTTAQKEKQKVLSTLLSDMRIHTGAQSHSTHKARAHHPTNSVERNSSALQPGDPQFTFKPHYINVFQVYCNRPSVSGYGV